ncbi:unnamed protein product [Ranitomeya imitator]|uniref:Uncharacterized protein n=1 Tax=Ranitomeya imitator TaxID=111125 RepID=A0ABN9KZW3_9NEOB|nr:unnamed protein product [Ranitomeya imitator]
MEEHSMEPGVFSYTVEDEERILSNMEEGAAFLKKPSIMEMKRIYENENKRLISSQLHLTTLGQYYKEHKIPRGLRSHIRPNLFLNNSTFCTRFTMISNKYAMDVMLLNIEYLQLEVKKLQSSVNENEKKIQDVLNKEDWTIFKDKIEKDLIKFRGDLEEMKRKKWSRDSSDYESGQVYAWQNDNIKTPWRKRGHSFYKETYNNNVIWCTNKYISHRLDGRSGKRKRRGGKRHHRQQKEIGKNQTPKTTEPEEKGTELVINISQKVLSDMEISVLSKGLSFSPCSHMDWFQLQLDLGQFFRMLKLKEWFSDKEFISKERTSELDLQRVGLLKESNFAPTTTSSVIEAFEKVVLMDIEDLRNNASREFRHPNILKEEFMALQGLVHDDDIVIKPADKGAAVVVMDKSMHIGEIMRQLQDENVYGRMEGDPKHNINKEIKIVLKQAVEGYIIDQDLHD